MTLRRLEIRNPGRLIVSVQVEACEGEKKLSSHTTQLLFIYSSFPKVPFAYLPSTLDKIEWKFKEGLSKNNMQ